MKTERNLFRSILNERKVYRKMGGQVYTVKTQKDIEIFLRQSNGLHDGYIQSVHYDDLGYERLENGSSRVYADRGELKIRVIITSLCDTVIELIFKSVTKWQIQCGPLNCIFGISVAFSDNGQIVWTDGPSTDEKTRQQGSYVIAGSMEYRFCEE